MGFLAYHTLLWQNSVDIEQRFNEIEEKIDSYDIVGPNGAKAQLNPIDKKEEATKAKPRGRIRPSRKRYLRNTADRFDLFNS